MLDLLGIDLHLLLAFAFLAVLVSSSEAGSIWFERIRKFLGLFHAALRLVEGFCIHFICAD